jgi:hypothetical protein
MDIERKAWYLTPKARLKQANRCIPLHRINRWCLGDVRWRGLNLLGKRLKMSVKFTQQKLPAGAGYVVISLAPSLSASTIIRKTQGLPQTQPTRTGLNHLNVSCLKERQTNLRICNYNIISSTHCRVSHRATVLAARPTVSRLITPGIRIFTPAISLGAAGADQLGKVLSEAFAAIGQSMRPGYGRPILWLRSHNIFAMSSSQIIQL